MAKVTGPLMSLDASGTVGKTTVFSKWKGRNYVRLRVTPMNKQSPGQQDARMRTGSVGRSMSIIALPVSPNLGSQFYIDSKLAAPAGQSWVSYAIRTILGSAFSTWDDNSADSLALEVTPKGYYEAAADDAGLADFAIAVLGTIEGVKKGEQLYHICAFMINQLSYPDFSDGLASPTENELAAVVVYLTTEVAPD